MAVHMPAPTPSSWFSSGAALTSPSSLFGPSPGALDSSDPALDSSDPALTLSLNGQTTLTSIGDVSELLQENHTGVIQPGLLHPEFTKIVFQLAGTGPITYQVASSSNTALSRADALAIIDNARELMTLETTVLEHHLKHTVAQYIRLRNIAYLDQQRLNVVKEKNGRMVESLVQLKEEMSKGKDEIQVTELVNIMEMFQMA